MGREFGPCSNKQYSVPSKRVPKPERPLPERRLLPRTHFQISRIT